jgi:hypothetical protein
LWPLSWCPATTILVPTLRRLVRRAWAALPRGQSRGRVRLRADAGYVAGQLAPVALFEGVEFAIGAKRITPLGPLLAGITDNDWVDAIDMDARSGRASLTTGRTGGP